MLTITDARFAQGSASNRRDFLRIGSLCGLTLSGLLAAKARAAERSVLRNKSVVFLFLHGGPPQIETFDPKRDVPENNRSCTGEVQTKLPGVWFGGTLPKLAQRADRVAVVRNFASRNGGHSALPVLTGGHRSGATVGAMCARGTGALSTRTGLPMNTVVIPEAVMPGLRLGEPTDTFGLKTLERDFGAAGSLGGAYRAFVRNGSAQQLGNFTLTVPRDRFTERFQLLRQLDTLKHTGQAEAGSDLQQQAHDLLLRGVSDAFDLSKEDPKVVARYDTSHVFDMADYHEGGKHFVFQGKKLVDQARWTNQLGKELLLARRLCEAGCGFVTVVDSSWDFHGRGMNNPGTIVGMNTLGAQLDHAVSAFLDDVKDRGLSDQILLVVTGEMGRSPLKHKGDAGTDHWGNLTPLLVAGGGLKMGQVVGRSDRTGGRPAGEAYGPEHLLATVLHTVFDASTARVAPELLSPEVAGALLNNDPIKELF